MKVDIEYRGRRGYEPRTHVASNLISDKVPRVEIFRRRSGGGVIEITVDDKLRFAKKEIGPFSTAAKVIATHD
jgi:Rdx family